MSEDLKKPVSELPSLLTLPPPPRRGFEVELSPPGSKSLTNRAMLLAALARGTSHIRSPLLTGEDAQVMRAGLVALGARVEERPDGSLDIEGVGGRWRNADVRLDLAGSGTAVRFLAAAAMLAPGPVTIDGSQRMRQRPIGELGELLIRFGCGVEYLESAGFPPLRVTPPAGGLKDPGVLEVSPMQSSQFISALLLVASFLPRGLTVKLTGQVTSASYIAMTVGLLAELGADVRTSENLHVIRVGPGEVGGLAPFDYGVEPDATGATYLWAGAAIVPGARCRVMGLDAASLQGDSQFPEVLGRMGARAVRRAGPEASIEVVGTRQLQPILADMSAMPDAAMTLASVACFATGTSILRGLKTLHVKESDRIAAVQAELTKLGVKVQTPVQNDPDAMTITPPPGGIDCSAGAPPVVFDTYDDHRMAMSLALIGLRRPNVAIRNPACVAKSYPGFWSDFARLYT